METSTTLRLAWKQPLGSLNLILPPSCMTNTAYRALESSRNVMSMEPSQLRVNLAISVSLGRMSFPADLRDLAAELLVDQGLDRLALGLVGERGFHDVQYPPLKGLEAPRDVWLGDRLFRRSGPRLGRLFQCAILGALRAGAFVRVAVEVAAVGADNTVRRGVLAVSLRRKALIRLFHN